MLDYEKKYLELTQGFLAIPDVTEEFPEATGFEKAVISMRRMGWNYSEIQSKLGMPSKKQIRVALLKWTPDLIDNSKTKVVKISKFESELYNIIKKHNGECFKIWGESWVFFIDANKLYYKDEKEEIWEFEDWDINSQSQILDEIKEQINDS